MRSIVFLEAFGRLLGEPPIDMEEEDLYSVFRARSELMGFSSTILSPRSHSHLWEMNEAELTTMEGRSRIGFVQVGQDAGNVDLQEALPALTQCFVDALGRFGVVELSAIQVTATHLGSPLRSHITELSTADNWFNLSNKAGVDGIVVLDHESLGGTTPLFSRYNKPRVYEFGQAVTVDEIHQVKIPAETPFYPTPSDDLGLGWQVMLPEWTASSIGWILAIVVDIVRAENSDGRSLAIRLSKFWQVDRS